MHTVEVPPFPFLSVSSLSHTCCQSSPPRLFPAIIYFLLQTSGFECQVVKKESPRVVLELGLLLLVAVAGDTDNPVSLVALNELRTSIWGYFFVLTPDLN